MQAVEIKMLPKQIELLACRDKWAAVRGGQGSGKTTALTWWLWQRCEEYPRANHVIVGPDYENLRRAFFADFRGLLEGQGLEDGRDYRYVDSPSPKIIFTHNGAKVHSLSAELAGRVRGVQIQTLVCEEIKEWQNGEEFFKQLSGRLRHNDITARTYGLDLQPQGRLVFNPPAKSHWLYGLIEKRWPRDGYKCWQMSVRENHLMLGADEYVHQMETNLNPEDWPAEIDGEWANVGGDVYRGFDAEIHGVPVSGLPPIALDPNKPLLWCMDFNVEWMSSVIAQAHVQQQVVSGIENKPGLPPKSITANAVAGWQKRVFYLLKELFLNDAGTPDVVEAFLSAENGLYAEVARKNGIVLYGDASGGARSQTMSSQSAARSNWEIVMQGLRAAGIRYIVRVPLTNPSVMDRINAVRAQFKTGAGYGLLVDLDNCPNLVNDFQMVQFKKGTNDIDKSDKSSEGLKRTHLSDAVGYLIHTEQRLARREKVEFRDFLAR